MKVMMMHVMREVCDEINEDKTGTPSAPSFGSEHMWKHHLKDTTLVKITGGLLQSGNWTKNLVRKLVHI